MWLREQCFIVHPNAGRVSGVSVLVVGNIMGVARRKLVRLNVAGIESSWRLFSDGMPFTYA